ncbi:MAG: 1,4-dihydroxy-6-naphthoate synthase, partial [Sphingobacteriales bacterium]
LNITKLSFAAFSRITDRYVLLNSGSALGFGVGPLLISSKKDIQVTDDLKVGIPGKYTTANFLLGIAYPQLRDKEEKVFCEIEPGLQSGETDLGLIIHENRFTYQDKGLFKVADLGEYWEAETGCAIPLGGIVIDRSLPLEIQQKVDRVIKRSVEFAFKNPGSGIDFIRANAQEMDESVMYKHIELYVNEYSIELGAEGRKAVDMLFKKAVEIGLIGPLKENIYLD